MYERVFRPDLQEALGRLLGFASGEMSCAHSLLKKCFSVSCILPNTSPPRTLTPRSKHPPILVTYRTRTETRSHISDFVPERTNPTIIHHLMQRTPRYRCFEGGYVGLVRGLVDCRGRRASGARKAV